MIILNSLPIVIIALSLIGSYIGMALKERSWPFYRTCLWVIGVCSGSIVMIEPMASLMHHHFVNHMYGHILLGMLAPLLMVLAAPITLLLKSLPTKSARKLTSFMNTGYVKFIMHPVTALVLNTGGLWLLYRTDLFMYMHHSALIYYLVHIHIFLAGYLFTSIMLYIDPVRNPYSFRYRAIVMMISVTLHQILSKSFYPYPPSGVETNQVEKGAMVMYYGGDVIELFIIFLMCLKWYNSVRPKRINQYNKQSSKRLNV